MQHASVLASTSQQRFALASGCHTGKCRNTAIIVRCHWSAIAHVCWSMVLCTKIPHSVAGCCALRCLRLLQAHSGMLKRAPAYCEAISEQWTVACNLASNPELPWILTGWLVAPVYPVWSVYCLPGFATAGTAVASIARPTCRSLPKGMLPAKKWLDASSEDPSRCKQLCTPDHALHCWCHPVRCMTEPITVVVQLGSYSSGHTCNVEHLQCLNTTGSAECNFAKCCCSRFVYVADMWTE